MSRSKRRSSRIAVLSLLVALALAVQVTSAGSVAVATPRPAGNSWSGGDVDGNG
jgi:hypothetical protein